VSDAYCLKVDQVSENDRMQVVFINVLEEMPWDSLSVVRVGGHISVLT
jgi:hypothetical protein